MAHTNSTTNLSLPQFIGTDKPTWLGDINGAFSAIDTYAGTNDAAVAAVDAKADNAVADASSAVTTATAANNTAGTASTTATSANNLATQALTVANNADGHTNQLETKVGLLADLHTTDKTSIVNAINEVADAEGDLSSLTTTDKTSLVAAINEVAQGGGGSVGSYSVIADGVKSYSDLLSELAALIDFSKIHIANLYMTGSGADKAIPVSNITDSQLNFSGITAAGSSNATMYNVVVRTTTPVYTNVVITANTYTPTNEVSNVPASGVKIIIYYI